jgi:hypothetical protein
VNRISGRTSLSCPRTSGNSSTSPRLEQNERTTLEPKALRGKLYRETYGTLSNDSTELLRQGQRSRIESRHTSIRLSACLPLSARHALCRPTSAFSDAPAVLRVLATYASAHSNAWLDHQYFGLLGPRASQLLNRLKKRRTIEIHLISIDQTASELNGANAVNFNAARPDWHRGMPFVQKTVANRNRAPMRPAPVRVMREQTNEIFKQGVATTKPSGNPRVTVVGIVGIEGNQIAWPIPAPRR